MLFKLNKPRFSNWFGFFLIPRDPILDEKFNWDWRVASISLYQEKNQKPMNLLLIILCFVLAYGIFAFIAFKIVKVLFPNPDSNDKPWKVRVP